MTSPRNPDKPPRQTDGRDTATPALPAWKAFVVQFTHETGTKPGAFSGRVEHLSTGQRARFESAQELVEFVNAVLQDPRLTRG
jgi:hypothetical protein